MEQKTKIWLSDFLILNFGTLLTAIGSYFFKFFHRIIKYILKFNSR